jgi:hypothetical protein
VPEQEVEPSTRGVVGISRSRRGNQGTYMANEMCSKVKVILKMDSRVENRSVDCSRQGTYA